MPNKNYGVSPTFFTCVWFFIILHYLLYKIFGRSSCHIQIHNLNVNDLHRSTNKFQLNFNLVSLKRASTSCSLVFMKHFTLKPLFNGRSYGSIVFCLFIYLSVCLSVCVLYVHPRKTVPLIYLSVWWSFKPMYTWFCRNSQDNPLHGWIHSVVLTLPAPIPDEEKKLT